MGMRKEISEVLTLGGYRVESWANPTIASLATDGPVCLIRYLGLQGKSPNRAPKCAVTIIASGARNSIYIDGEQLEEIEEIIIDVLNGIGLYPELDSTVVSYNDGELTSLLSNTITNRFIAMTILVSGDPR